MPRVTVDVDLDEFDLDDLLDEVTDRYGNKRNQKEIDDWVEDALNLKHNPKNLSLLDQMKIDFLMNNLDEIKLNDLEKLI